MENRGDITYSLEYWAFIVGAGLRKYLLRHEKAYMVNRRTFRPALVTALLASHLRMTRQFDEENRDMFILNPEAARALDAQAIHETQLPEYVERQMKPATSIDRIIHRFERWSTTYSRMINSQTAYENLPPYSPAVPRGPRSLILSASTKDYTDCKPSPSRDARMTYPGQMAIATKELAEMLQLKVGQPLDVELWLPSIIKQIDKATNKSFPGSPRQAVPTDKVIIYTKFLEKGKAIFPAQAMHWEQTRGFVLRHLEEAK